MSYQSPVIVIDNGSHTTKAGFSQDYIPSLVFNSSYLTSDNSKIVVGDEIDEYPENDVYTFMDSGTIYNFDNIIHNWQYVYDNLDNKEPLNSKEFPLMMTEQPWNTSKNKLTTTQIAFESLEVPLFSLVKTPLVQLYQMGRASGLVIDIGSSVASVTPILDGIIQTKSTFHSKYAGDFANLHSMNYLKSHKSLDDLIPRKFQGSRMSETFKNYQISYRTLEDFKYSMLTVNEMLTNNDSSVTKYFQLPRKDHVAVHSEQWSLLENLFQPKFSPLPDVSLPDPTINKPQSNGLSTLALLAIKSMESSFIPLNDSMTPGNMNSRYTKFNEILRELLSNILITGGSSLAVGLQQRLINDIYKQAHLFFPNYLITQPGRLVLGTLGNFQQNDLNQVWDKKFGAWIGASNLANMLKGTPDNNNGVNIALDNWFISKSDYEELGEDLVLEKFK